MGSLMDIALEAANLHYRKQYAKALNLLDSNFEFTTKKEDIAQFHINYAMNYEKLKDIEKCNYHCEKAIKLHHCGTYAYRKLIINYVKAKDWENALRICNILIDRENRSEKLKKENKPNIGYEGTPLNWGDFSEYARKRKEFILKKLKEEGQ